MRLLINHVDQQLSRIGRKISHVYCIVRTQDSYVSFKRPGYVEARPEKSRFFLATNLGWRSTNAIKNKHKRNKFFIMLKRNCSSNTRQLVILQIWRLSKVRTGWLYE